MCYANPINITIIYVQTWSIVVRSQCIHRIVLVANHFATHFIITNTINRKDDRRATLSTCTAEFQTDALKQDMNTSFQEAESNLFLRQ